MTLPYCEWDLKLWSKPEAAHAHVKRLLHRIPQTCFHFFICLVIDSTLNSTETQFSASVYTTFLASLWEVVGKLYQEGPQLTNSCRATNKQHYHLIAKEGQDRETAILIKKISLQRVVMTMGSSCCMVIGIAASVYTPLWLQSIHLVGYQFGHQWNGNWLVVLCDSQPSY